MLGSPNIGVPNLGDPNIAVPNIGVPNILVSDTDEVIFPMHLVALILFMNLEDCLESIVDVDVELTHMWGTLIYGGRHGGSPIYGGPPYVGVPYLWGDIHIWGTPM